MKSGSCVHEHESAVFTTWNVKVKGYHRGAVDSCTFYTCTLEFCSVVKSRARAAQPPESQETGKAADIPMDTNQTMDARYQAGGKMQEGEERLIYELPAAV